MISKVVKVLIVGGVSSGLLVCYLLWVQQNAQMEKLRHKRVWETIQMMTRAMHQGIRDNELRSDTVEPYFSAYLPAKKICSENAMRQGCWTKSQGRLQETFQTVLPEETYPGMILDNGIVLTGFEPRSPKDYRNPFILDWNGEEGPNRIGDDQLYLDLCLDARQCGSSSAPGMITPVFSVSGAASTENQKLYDHIFRLSI